MTTNRENAGPGLRTALGIVMHPPFFVRLIRAFTFPLVVMTRRNLGERYYRNGVLGRIVIYSACMLPIPAAALLMLPAKLYLAAIGIAFAVGSSFAAYYVVSDIGCRREIASRKTRGIHVHSYSFGVPRFGLPDTQETNWVRLPRASLFLGVAIGSLNLVLGLYLFWASVAMLLEGAWVRWSGRQLELDELDSRSGGSASQPIGAIEEVPVGDHLANINPLEGFEEVLGISKPK